MEIGNAGVGKGEGIWQNLSVAESRTHFALWSLLKSPMLLGCDLNAQVPEVIKILKNEEATAFNQDKLGIQATMISSTNVTQPERYMRMAECDAAEPRQLGWTIEADGSVRTATGMCISTLWPMFEAALRPCNATDVRQQWTYNASRGTLATKQAFAEQPACLMTSFAHAMRGSSVSVAICRTTGPRWAVTQHGQLSTAGPNPQADSGSAERVVKKPAASCVVRADSTPIESALGIGQLQVYAGRVDGGFGVGLVNVDTIEAHNITVTWAELGVSPQQQMHVRDIYKREDMGSIAGRFTARVEPHDTVLLRISKEARRSLKHDDDRLHGTCTVDPGQCAGNSTAIGTLHGVTSEQACCDACGTKGGCVAFHYNAGLKKCVLLSVYRPVPGERCSCGRIGSGPSPPPPPPPPPKPPPPPPAPPPAPPPPAPPAPTPPTPVPAGLVPAQLQADYEALRGDWTLVEKPNDVSPLAVFGDSAFPVIADGPGGVAMAGARMGKGRVIAAGHQVWANFACFQLDNALLEANMLRWLRPGRIAGTGKVLVGGFESDCCRNGSNPITCPPGVGTIAERLAFLKKAGYSDADMVPDSRLHPHSPWDYLPNFNIDDYDLVILRRVEDSLFLNATRIAQVKDFITRGGSAVLTGRMWEWNSAKKYNEPVGITTERNHPLNIICASVGIVVQAGTLHSSGKGGIGPSGGVLDSNILYILRFLAGLTEQQAAEQTGRLATVSSNVDAAIDNAAPGALDPQLWVAMEEVLAAPLCSASSVNYNPTLENPVSHKDSQNIFCVEMLIRLRAFSGKQYKDTSKTLSFFPGDASSTELTSKTMTLHATRRRWMATGMYAKPGVPVVARLLSHDGSLSAPLQVQVGSHNWVDGAADHGVGWLVPWVRFPELTASAALVPTAAGGSSFVNVTCWFGGLIYVDVDDELLGHTLQLEVSNALAAPSYQHGVTTAAEWEVARSNPAPYGEIEMDELIFTVNASEYRHLSFEQMSAVGKYWSAATCQVMSLFRQPPGGNRSKTRITFDVVTADAGNWKTRWGQPNDDGSRLNYPSKAWAPGCEVCVSTGYPGDVEGVFAMDWKETQRHSQWELLYLLGAREQKAMYHPSGFNTDRVLPNIAPMYVTTKLGMAPRNLSGWKATAATLKARVPGPTRSHSGRYSWYESCPAGWPLVAQERDCLTNAMLFAEVAEAFGWECFEHVFDYYAHNLTHQTKVGNNDQKADNYWYWFLSVATQRDLTLFFNADTSWAYGERKPVLLPLPPPRSMYAASLTYLLL